MLRRVFCALSKRLFTSFNLERRLYQNADAMEKGSYSNTEEYIAGFPEEVQVLLQLIRRTIREAAPEAGECISYGIPTFTYKGNLVHFGGYKNHIGFYPGALAIKTFKEEFDGYKWAKGSVQFPLNKPLPLELVSRIVKFRLEKTKEKEEALKSIRK